MTGCARIMKRGIRLKLATTFVLPIFFLAFDNAAAQPAEPWTEAQLIQPAALAARLKDSGAAKPKILYVGPQVLYRGNHIPNAQFVGMAARLQGLEALRQAAAALPREEEVVIYCGCCPWKECPNIRPAFRLLQQMGFKQAKVLALPTNFLKDWIEKGYPIVKGGS